MGAIGLDEKPPTMQAAMEKLRELREEIRARYRKDGVHPLVMENVLRPLASRSDPPKPFAEKDLGVTLDSTKIHQLVGFVSKLNDMTIEFDKRLQQADEELARAEAALSEVAKSEVARVAFEGLK